MKTNGEEEKIYDLERDGLAIVTLIPYNEEIKLYHGFYQDYRPGKLFELLNKCDDKGRFNPKEVAPHQNIPEKERDELMQKEYDFYNSETKKALVSKIEFDSLYITFRRWVEIEKPKPGAVIIWEPFKAAIHGLFGDKEAKLWHIGFCVTEMEAISNDSKGSGFPWRHHITYNGTRKIEKIYWHSELDKN